MAAKKVTRTFTVTEVTFMVYAMGATSVTTESVTLIGKHTTDSAMKYARKELETTEKRYVCAASATTTEVLRGMTEDEFWNHSETLPPRAVSAE